MTKTKLFGCLVAMALLCGNALALVPGAFSKKITFSTAGYAGSEALTDFPVLVRLSAEKIAEFSYDDFKLENGGDLRFSDASGEELSFEIEVWNPEGESLVWVKLPSLTAATTFTAYYGCAEPEAATHTTADVWTPYIGVWHLDDLTDAKGRLGLSKAKDTGSSNDAKLGGAYANPSGDAWNNYHLSCANYESYATDISKFTFSGWYKTIYFKHGARLCGHKASYQGTGWDIMFFNNAGNVGIMMRGNEGTGGVLFPVSNTSEYFHNKWIYMTFVYDGTDLTAYMNGEQVVAGKITKVTSPGNVGLYIGGNYNSTQFQGIMDEFRLYDGVSSADRVKADYDTINNENFLLNAGAQATDTSKPVIYAKPATSLSSSAAVANGEILSMNGTLVLSIIYGATAEGMAHTNQVGTFSAPAGFAYEFENLLADTDYSYAFITELGEEVVETSSITFRTTGAPKFGEVGAEVEANNATFTGALTDVGLGGVTLTLVMGDSPDAMTAVESWEGVDEPATQSKTVEDLVWGGTYYYAWIASCPAPNRADIVVSSATNKIEIAGTIIWKGAMDTLWLNANNWEPSVVPTANLDVLFNTSGDVAVTADANDSLFANDVCFDAASSTTTFDLGSGSLSVASLKNGVSANNYVRTVWSNVNLTVSGRLALGDKNCDNAKITFGENANVTANNIYVNYCYHPALTVGNGADVSVEGAFHLNDSTWYAAITVGQGGKLTVGSMFATCGGNAITVDGGELINNGDWKSGQKRRANTIRFTNGARVTSHGTFSAAPYRSLCEVSQGATLSIDRACCLGWETDGIDFGSGSRLVVSNATVNAERLLVPGDNRYLDAGVILYEDEGETTTVTTTGDVIIGWPQGRDNTQDFNSHNFIEVNGGALAVGGKLRLGCLDKAICTNQMLIVSGPSARITAASLSVTNQCKLVFTIPENGYAAVPLAITGAATIYPDTKLIVDGRNYKGNGLVTLMTAGTLADDTFSEEQIECSGHGSVRIKNNKLIFRSSKSGLVMIIR